MGVRERVEELRKQIRHHDWKYYAENDPEISDSEYDLLYAELVALEKTNPELVTLNSPTQRVGAPPLEGFEEVTHSLPMLSIENAYTSEEVVDRLEKMRSALGAESVDFVVELKLDGVGIELTYLDGLFVRGSTRGDGHVGEDVTANVRTIRTVPLTIPVKGPLEVRGEVVMRKSVFERVNRSRAEAGEELFANPRNASAGTLRQLDSRITASRKLDFFAYQVIGCEDLDDQSNVLTWLHALGFQVESSWLVRRNPRAVIEYYNSYVKMRGSLDYEVDGVVVKVDSLAQQEALGATSSHPKWMVAFKFPASQATTKILDVTFQVGRTGTVVPVAELASIELAGAVITRSTLHNFDEVARLGVKVGDTVLISRAGDVIPRVIKVVEEKRTGDEVEILLPVRCPACGGEIERLEGEVAIRCINPNCSSRVVGHLRHFVERESMDVDGLGGETLKKMVDAGLVQDPADLYFLTKEDLEGLPGVKGKTIENILSAIEKSKGRGLAAILHTLGIPKVGEHLSGILVEYYPTIDSLMAATEEELEEIDAIGPIISHSIVAFFQQEKNRELIEKFRKAGVRLTADQPDRSGESSTLEGKVFVLTGALSIKRSEMKERIKSCGGTVSDSVSGGTDFLVVGEKPGSKLDRAKELEITILTEDDVNRMIQNG
jgi:DNA ligase (NAD+)